MYLGKVRLLYMYTPQCVWESPMQLGGSDQSKVQIKNIKLHIVTDIKVTINSLSVFGFRYLVGGRVTTMLKKTMSKFSPDLWSYVLCTCMSYKGMYTYHTCMHIRPCVYTLHLCMYIVCLYVNWVFMWTESNVNVSYVWME